ncbi:MAG TPA: copper transporter [Nocardioides sp.]|nr:copper transporter [Nocardioides sp.]
MIRHRSYAVPLTAVLLALATGIALGAGPLTDTGSSASPGPRVLTPAPDAADADAFAGAVATRLYDHGLSRRPVAVVTMPGADRATVAALVTQVKAAGGELTGTYAVQPQLVDANQKSLVDTMGIQLAKQVGGVDKAATTYPRMGLLLAIALATTAKTGVQAGDDAVAVRQSLAAAHLLAVPQGGPPTAPLVLVVLGSPVDQAIADGVLEGLAGGARGVVAVAPTRDAVLAGLATDGVTKRVTTVDGSETEAGRVAAVLGLVRAWNKPGGAFGASGSDGAAPLG